MRGRGARFQATAAEWLKVDKSALEDYLKCGVSEELEEFFDNFILPLGTMRRSTIVKNYMLLDIVFTTARLIKQWGGEPDQVVPELNQLEALLANVDSIEDIKTHAQPILNRALAFRDAQANTAARRRDSASPRVHPRSLHGFGHFAARRRQPGRPQSVALLHRLQ